MPHSNLTAEERFWLYVRKSDGCWLWSGAPTGSGGYGQLRVLQTIDGRSQRYGGQP